VPPAHPSSASQPGAISVVGNSGDLTRMMQRLLLDEAVARAAASLLPTHARELTLRETKTKGPKGEPTSRGYSIEVPPKFRNQQLRDAVCHLALRESVLRDLTTFSLAGTIPADARQQLALLAQPIVGQQAPDERQLRAAIASSFASTLPSLAELNQAASRHIATATTPRSALTAQSGAGFVEGAIAALGRLRALAWLDPAENAHDTFCERGEAAFSKVVAAVSALWDSGVGSRDLKDAPEAIRLYSRLLTVLQQGCFDRLPPVFYLPSASDAPQQLTTAAKIHRMLNRIPGRPTAALARFLPEQTRELPAVVQSLERSLAMMRAGADWVPENTEDIDGSIFEQLMDTLPGAVESLGKLSSSILTDMPEPLSHFVEALVRLRFHGTPDGLRSLHIIATPLVSREQQQALMGNPDYFTETHIRDFSDMVEFVASWPVRSPAIRAEIVERQMTPLCEAFARAISVISANFSLTSSACMRDGIRLAATSGEQLFRDIDSFEECLKVLAPHLRDPALIKAMGELPNKMLKPLRVAFSVLQLPLDKDDLLARVALVGSWPTEFGDSGYEQEIRQYTERTRAEVFAEADEHSASLTRSLKEASERGEVEEFAASLDQFMQLANALGISSVQIKDRASLVDRLALELINEIHDAFERDLATVSSKLSLGSASPADIASGTDMLSLQLSQFAALRECLLKHEPLVKPERVHHLQGRVTDIVSRHSALAVRLVQSLHSQLQDSPSPELLRSAQLLLRLRECARLLRNIAPGDLSELERLIAHSSRK